MGRAILGIELGHASLKVAGVVQGAKPRLIGCKEVSLEPRYLGKEELSDPQIVADALRQAMATAAPSKVSPAPCVLALSEAVLFRKILELPVLDNLDDLRSVVAVQAAEYLPLPIDEMELDFQVISPVSETKTEQVMIVAVSSKLLASYVAAFRLAKLSLEAIDTKPASLGRVCIASSEKEAWVLVDIGAELSTVSIYHHGMVQVTSTINLGGNSLHDPATGQIDSEREPALLKHLIEGLVEEIEHVRKFYANRSFDGHPLKQILLSGGGSLIVGIKEALDGLVSLPVAMAAPQLVVPAFCDRRFNGALGAALYPLHGRN